MLFDCEGLPKCGVIGGRDQSGAFGDIFRLSSQLFPDEPSVDSSIGGIPTDKAWTVSQLTTRLNAQLRTGFSQILVTGEVSNLRRQASGHIYFTLKDQNATLPAVAFQAVARAIRFDLTDGLEIIVSGKLDYYGPHGRLQMIASKINPVGEGELELAFRQLQEKLQKEGLFEPSRKKTLSAYPQRIALVTGANTAALRDMLESLKVRWPIAEVWLFPVLVQGPGAPPAISSTLRWINALGDNPAHCIDLLLLARGGGSREDLWCFNHETVARAIAACKVPVVTGIGHENDVTIADLVADVRALTPTDAVTRSTPDRRECLRSLVIYRESMVQLVVRRVERLRQRLARAKPQVLGRLLQGRMARARQRVTESSRRIQVALIGQVSDRRKRLAIMAAKLDAISPLRVLARGYSLTYTNSIENNQGPLIRSVKQVKLGDLLQTRLEYGSVISEVREVITPREKPESGQ